jgi:hypothetical protein
MTGRLESDKSSSAPQRSGSKEPDLPGPERDFMDGFMNGTWQVPLLVFVWGAVGWFMAGSGVRG